MSVRMLRNQPVIEFLADEFDAEPFEVEGFTFRPTDANLVFGPDGAFRYASVHGWLVEGDDQYAGRYRIETSGNRLSSAPKFVRHLVLGLGIRALAEAART